MLGRSHRYTGLLAASVSLTPIVYFFPRKNLFWILQDAVDLQSAFLKSFIALGSHQKGVFAGYLILYFLASIIGSILPDKDMLLKRFYGDKKDERFRYHRQWTHSILLWGLLTAFAFYAFFNDFNPLIWVSLIGLCVGAWSHLIGDMITGSVPWGLYGKYYDRFSRFGITVFLPKAMHTTFTEKLPRKIERHSWIILLIAIFYSAYLIYFYNSNYFVNYPPAKAGRLLVSTIDS